MPVPESGVSGQQQTVNIQIISKESVAVVMWVTKQRKAGECVAELFLNLHVQGKQRKHFTSFLYVCGSCFPSSL